MLLGILIVEPLEMYEKLFHTVNWTRASCMQCEHPNHSAIRHHEDPHFGGKYLSANTILFMWVFRIDKPGVINSWNSNTTIRHYWSDIWRVNNYKLKYQFLQTLFQQAPSAAENKFIFWSRTSIEFNYHNLYSQSFLCNKHVNAPFKMYYKLKRNLLMCPFFN